MQKNTHPICSGALLLTVTGLFCRLLGFYYKIFLSRTIGAKELGLYQLAMPLLAIGIAFASSGFHTAISRYVAKSISAKSGTERAYLNIGIFLSLAFSALFCIPCLLFAPKIAANIFCEPSITTLLYPLILCIPLECFHGCINDYTMVCKNQPFHPRVNVLNSLSGLAVSLHATTFLPSVVCPSQNSMLCSDCFFGEIASTFYYLNILVFSKKKKPCVHASIKKSHITRPFIHGMSFKYDAPASDLVTRC